MITLGVPCKDRHEYTYALIDSLTKTVSFRPHFRLVLIDNGSQKPYDLADLHAAPWPISLIRYEENQGFYSPLRDLVAQYPSEYVGLVHNDVLFYEHGWDWRMTKAFETNPSLGLIGMCGSWKLDSSGGRGDATMCYFRGERGQSQSAGTRVTDLHPALILDSLCMVFRSEALKALQLETDDPPLAHFWDKLWPLRLLEGGWKTAVLGTEIDHWGGITAADFTSFEDDARKWCEARSVPVAVGDDGRGGTGPCWGLGLYLEAERRFVSEASRMHMLPSWIGPDWTVHPGENGPEGEP